MNNYGVYNNGSASFDSCTFGPHSPITQTGRSAEPVSNWDVGVITIIPVETLSLRREFSLSPSDSGFHTGTVEKDGHCKRIVALQTQGEGRGAAINAAANLVKRYSPKVLALAGIAGSINPGIRIGDTVITTTVIGYDLRRETPEGIRRRGRTWEAPVDCGRAVNEFFSTYGEPAEFPGFKVYPGLIGSGDAVIAAQDSDKRRYLLDFNEKTVAVDMESDGLGQFCHENQARRWVVVRGISDDATERKCDDFQAKAATNAAVTLGRLLPYLPG